MHSPGNTTDAQDMIKTATVSLMTDYLNPRADSEILQVVKFNYAKAGRVTFRGMHDYRAGTSLLYAGMMVAVVQGIHVCSVGY